MNSYRDLIVWQKSILLVKEVYRVTQLFPKTEQYGLSDQLRRAAVSVPSNIAEGFSRKYVKENAQFISIAFGSTSEMDTQLLLAQELQMVSVHELESGLALLVEVRKMLNAMLSRLKSNG